MNTDELLREARARGATFQVIEEGRLRVQAPSPLPEDLMAELRQHKTRILSLLAGETAASLSERMGQEDIDRLLAWAAHAAEVGLTLPEVVQFWETSLRQITTAQVGRYCRDQLKYLSLARSNRATGGWGRFTPEWWQGMGAKALQALSAIKAAMEEAGLVSHGLDPNQEGDLRS
jgi:hypothetical protein